jgi:hypothetical protein
MFIRMYRNPNDHVGYRRFGYDKLHLVRLLWLGPVFVMWKRG